MDDDVMRLAGAALARVLSSSLSATGRAKPETGRLAGDQGRRQRMIITVRRWRRAADGAWDEMLPPVTLSSPPEEAWAYARHRDSGPLATTVDEIVRGCEDKYRRVQLHGFATPGDIDISVEIYRAA